MRIGRKIYFLIIFSTVFLSAYGQDATKEAAKQLVEIANEAYFNLRVIVIANEQYVQAAEMDPDNIEANYMAGRTFLETNSKSKATKYFLKVLELDPGYKYNIHYLIGQAYQYGTQFNEAIEHYNQYQQLLQQNQRRGGADFTSAQEVEQRILECQNGLEYLMNPIDYKIENLGPDINSEWDDYGPVVTADESFMVFTTRRQEGNSNMDVFDDMLYYEDVFFTNNSGGKWQPAKNIGPPINNIYHSSNLAINAEGSQLYLYRSQNGGDVFLSERNSDGSWTEPEPLNDNINSSFSENSVSISPDGNTLYFSSDRPITPDKVDLDIYYSKKNRKGEWGSPVNIKAVNTDFDEDGVFIDYDGKTLYFSSKGHKGMGGFDIYKSIYDEEKDEWSPPENLGYPMNSPDNDIYFVSTRDGKGGYYASAKVDGYGFMDIYYVRLVDDEVPQEVVAVKEEEPVLPIEELPVEAPIVEQPKPVELLLKTVDNQSNVTIEADISIMNSNTKRPIPVKRIGVGLYQAYFSDTSSKNYSITVEKAGYMYQNASITIPEMTTKSSRLAKQIGLDKVKVGMIRIIRNVYFDFGTARLKDTSDPELKKLLKVLEENPQYIIQISGHTDSFGTKAFNLTLSERRAQAVVSRMVRKGQSDGRFLVEGYGEERPLASNDDEKLGRELNRRVEFKVLRFRQ